MDERKELRRRDFMKNALVGGVGLTVAGGVAAGGAAAEEKADREGGSTAEAKVPRAPLGKTGETIPRLFMGGGQKFDPKYDRLLHRAFRLGIDYIDTSQEYAQGQSHRGIATFLEQVGRENVWITTKTAQEGSQNTPQAFKQGLDECLEEMRTDYVDMYFMHGIKDEGNLEPDFIKMADELRKSGKTKFFGFSCHDGNVPELLAKSARVGGIDAIMFRYSFRDYGDTRLNEAIDAAHAAGIGLLAMKTQASVPKDLEKVLEFESQEFTLAQAKLKSVWADERIAGTVSGMTNIQLLEENAAAAMSTVELSMGEFHQLNRLARVTAPYACRGCSHICEGAIAGDLKVADALRYLMYDECYGDRETAQRLYAGLSSRERDFESVDLGGAIEACPQGIRIDERLEHARRRLS